MPCAQLIYCRDVADFVRFAGPIGRSWPGAAGLSSSSTRTAPYPGWSAGFSRGKMPKYFKGPQRPRLGDLAYTEYAMLGV